MNSLVRSGIYNDNGKLLLTIIKMIIITPNRETLHFSAK